MDLINLFVQFEITQTVLIALVGTLIAPFVLVVVWLVHLRKNA